MKLVTKSLLCLAIFLPSFVLADVIYVNHAALGLNNGTDWQNAFVDLQNALNSIPAPDTIWIAEGTYYPTDGTDRNIYFQIPNGVAIFGGFQGIESQLDQRDWETYQTILSGDIGEQGNFSDNSYTILYATQTDTTTLIDGLNIMFGNANSYINGESSYEKTKSGGGLYLYGLGNNNQAAIKIINCTFQENFSKATGGAIFCYGFYGSVDFLIINTNFTNNESESVGGAICKLGGCNEIQKIISCEFENNRSGSYGGAVFTNDLNVFIDLNFINCDFINNMAHIGGAIGRLSEYENNNNLVISNCMFQSNESFRGGAISDESYFSVGNIYISNSVFMDNAASGYGGVFYDESLTQKRLIISNSIFQSNNSPLGGVFYIDYPLYSVNNLYFNNSASQGACINSRNSTKIFNNTFFNNNASTGSIFKGLYQPDVEVLNSIFFGNGINSFSSFNSLDIETSIFDVNSCNSISSSSNINCSPTVLFNVDPLFRDPVDLDFSLLSCSPAINAGNTAIIDFFGILEDLAGNDRVMDGIVDIGAFEQEAISITQDSVQNESCFGISNGAAYLSSSGNPPFDISWQSGNDSGTNTTGLAPGVYDFTLIDADGCNDTLAVEIEAAPALMSNFDSIQHESCFGNSNGAAYLSSSGNPPFDISWQSGNDSGTNTTGLAPGVYDFTLIDAEGCSDTLTVEIEAATPLMTNFDSIQHESCFGNSNGAVYLSSSGIPPFDISWESGNESGTNTTGLAPGVYDFTLIDAEGCSDTLTVEIETASAMPIEFESIQHESCFGNSNGAVYLSSSGNPPFDISWQSGNDSGTNTSGLAPGVYDFIIIDAEGCSDTLTIEIEAATALTTNFESNDASGSEIADGSIDFEVITGGTPGYTYEWNTGQTTASISDLLPGNYFLTVTDAIFCKYGFAFYVGGITGLEDLEAGNNFQIQPNPAHGFLTIKLEHTLSEDHQFQLFDELGRLVLKRDLPFLQTEYYISLDQITPGFYHYAIANDQSVVKTGKLVIF